MADDGTSARRAAIRSAGLDAQLPWRVPINPDRPLDPLDDEGVAAVAAAVERILRDVGIEITGAEPEDETLAAFRAAGARVEGTHVRFDPDALGPLLALAPAQFTLTPRNPERAVTLGGRHMVFAPVASAVDVWDIERGRRPADFAACREFLALAQSFDCIHMLAGYPAEPQDIPAPVRHLDCTLAALTLTDKVIHAYPLGRPAVEDVLTLARLAAGLSEREFGERPRLHMNINSLSPLRYDARAIESALTCARAGQAVIVTPFVLSDSPAAMSMVAAVTLALAEALAVVALIQAVRPGAPVVLGALISHLAPRSGLPVFGTPDTFRATQIAGQMARHYGLPLRATGGCSANVPDGQAMAETAGSLWCAVQSRAHVVYHAAGWLSGGLSASLEKFVMDCELLQMVERYFEAAPVPRSAEDLVSSILREGAAGGEPFYTPLLADWRSYELWQEDGAVWTSERAHRFARAAVEAFEPPPLDPARAEAMRDHAARRRRLLGFVD